MASTFTPNIQIEEPARGDDVGTWDTPVNNNSTLLDLVLGGIATIGLNNANVTLNAGQFQCAQLTFNSTLTGSVAITFPSTFKKAYTIQNVCTGSSAFTITLQTTVAGTQVICCPPGQPFEVVNNGTNIVYRNFGPHIGGYWDYAGSSVPSWVSGCTVAPYLNCDGSTFSAATFPTLAVIMGSTTLPDLRGRHRTYLNQGTGRITSSQTGVDGNTLFSAGGTVLISSQNLPSTALNEPSSGHTHNTIVSNQPPSNPAQYGYAGGGSVFTTPTGAATTGITFGSSSPLGIVPPTAIGGLTLIRAA